jgi:ribosomal protein S11
MEQVQNNFIRTFAPLALFSAVAYLAGSKRCIKYFPNATEEGLILSGILGGVAVAGNRIYEEQLKGKPLKQHLCLLGSLAVCAALAPHVVNVLNSSAKITRVASFRFAILEAVMLYALEFSPDLPLSESAQLANELKQAYLKEGKSEIALDDYQKVISSTLDRAGLSGGLKCFAAGDHLKVVTMLKALDVLGLFTTKNHEVAKKTFKDAMEHLGLGVSYVDASGWNHKQLEGYLDLSIFRWSATTGVQNDIPAASSDKDRVHIFSVASQYNAAEAPSPFTPPVAKAMEKSTYDNTQGPLAQRTNPVVFELVTAFLTNLGFNMMEYALPSAGSTHKVRSTIEHGYLRPHNQNIEELSTEMQNHFQKLEVPCYESRPTPSGESVYLMLGAAPAIGYSYGLTRDSRNLQYHAFLANFTAQFKQTLLLLDENPTKEIILHVTGTGLGVFGCDHKVFEAAFKQAALEFQTKLKKTDQTRVHVQLEAYKGKDDVKKVGEALLGAMKPRVQ